MHTLSLARRVAAAILVLQVVGCGPAADTGPGTPPPGGSEPPASGRRLAEVPEELNLSREIASENLHYRVRLIGPPNPTLNDLHTWECTIETADHAAPADAIVRVDGGMPQHDHGLPTQPQVVATGEPGRYEIQGVRFHMRGWWRLTLDIDGRAGRDVARFDLVLE